MSRLALALLGMWCVEVHAVLPGAPPRPAEEASLAMMRACQTFSVRAAWGAQARFKGAPSAFKYVARDAVREYFMGDNAPHDGIYVAEDMDLSERRAYEEVAFFGWTRMDVWLKADPNQQEPDWAAFPAVFYKMCKEAASADGGDVLLN